MDLAAMEAASSLLQGKREERSVVAIKVANKVPKGAKTTPFGNQNPTEIPCFISGLRVAVKTAKPLRPFMEKSKGSGEGTQSENTSRAVPPQFSPGLVLSEFGVNLVSNRADYAGFAGCTGS